MTNQTATPTETRPDNLTTAHLADACVRLGIPVRCPPQRPAFRGARVGGPAVPVIHLGSVDVILETLGSCPPGAVLAVDDGARLDRACVGDLIALEAQAAGAAGLVVDGCHRDTDELESVGLGVFSLAAHPSGPLTVDAPRSDPRPARLGRFDVTADDWIVGDADGVLLIPSTRVADVTAAAAQIRETERRQAERLHDGSSLRQQLRFAEYLEERDRNPGYGFRDHLTHIGGAIEQ